MAEIPPTIPGIGSVALQPRPNIAFDPSKHGLTSDDYFVFTRIDGRTTLKNIILETGFSPERAIEILNRLRTAGAFMLPGELVAPRGGGAAGTPSARASTRIPVAPPPARVKPRPAPAQAAPEPVQPDAPAEPLHDLAMTPQERAAMAESVALSDEQKQEVLRLLRLIHQGDLHGLLGVAPGVGKRDLKRAYFKISKRFHPDRFFGRELGSFGPLLSTLFEAASKAFAQLSDPRVLAAASADGVPSAGDSSAQSRQEHAAELFEQACRLEAQGNSANALKLFSAVIRQDGRAAYVGRAARCAVSAGELNLAEEYAKKAAELQSNDASYGRLLATVYRAAGKLQLAEDTLVHALTLNTDNDVLVAELQADLAKVRRQRGTER